MALTLSAPVVGVYHDAPESFLPILRTCVPERRLLVCTSWDGLEAILPEVDVLLAFRFRGQPFPRDGILAAPRLKWVQLSSAGIDHLLPFDPARVTVTNTSGLHGDSIAWYVMAGLAHLAWNIPRFQRQQAERRWTRSEVPAPGGRTIAILGAGRIGTRVAAAARAVGMCPLGINRSGRPAPGFDRMHRMDDLGEVLARADYVVVTLPLTRETRGRLDDAALGWMQPSSYLVNVARGGIVDEGALLRRLRDGSIAGAVLDVFEREPLPESSAFWTLPNVLITPHVAGEFERWPEAVAHFFCANLRRWTAGEALENVVDPVAGY